MVKVKGHRNNSRFIKFENRNDMNRFILLYKDLFVPYSESMIRTEAYVVDGYYPGVNRYNTHKSYGHMDENIVTMMRQGYRIEGDMLKINIFPEDFKVISEACCFENGGTRHPRKYRPVNTILKYVCSF